MPHKIPDDFRRLFEDPRAFAFVATTMEDNSPQVTPVWVTLDNDQVVFNTAEGRTKWKNLKKRPDVALAVMDPDNPYRYIQVRGQAHLETEGAEEMIDALARKYTGADVYAGRAPDEVRVTFRIEPESVQTMG